ncbi:GntR family transcriptional regulator [Amycolatopsis acidiphila]|uniref:GntR family transcriptional regulator n=1 Tax=Amycolatopsis acidiphila TaxID=715473 RepID=A0A558A6E2_9PSEU|nr:GntR family transcriptional regulator [Amycolatopsis acidiphila]TVT19830.1 GntR family transcriptional regulator [Amycolatopsis acidiphila]UIJ58734.1 GntR family transcriptional regulator [Amycolatopsis acidiphila]GHG71643.1 putative HTH-type transcriptional regulator YmfC [Amycolatopsis acidiphila]
MITRNPAGAKKPVTIETVTADSYRQAKDRLRDAIARLGEEGRFRLPSEAELSTALGVSRATIRSALQSLQKEGRIRRLHGQGTFINRHAIGIGANLAEASPFIDLLEQAGYRPGVRTLDQRVVALDQELAASLELPVGDRALRIERVFEANGEPAVHSVDYVPANLLGDHPEERDPRRSTFEFVEVGAGLSVCYSVAEVRPVLPPRPVVTALDVKRSHPVLRLRHTHIRANELPVAVTVVHVNDDYLRFSVIRTYLDQ